MSCSLILAAALCCPAAPPAGSGPGLRSPAAPALLPAQDEGKGQEPGEGEKKEEPTDPEEKLTLEIQTNLKQISYAEQASYDGKILKLTYTKGVNFEGDAELYGKNDPRYLIFRRDHAQLRLARLPKFCFAGNTFGSLLLRPRFVGRVEVEAVLFFQLVDRGGTFYLTVHSDGRQYWGTCYGVHLLHKKKRARRPKLYPCPVPQYKKDPRDWIDRAARAGQTVGLIYDPEKGLLESKYKGSRVNRIKLKGEPQSGRVGFQWRGAKFVVMSVEIKGVLDRKWAAEMLNNPRNEHPDD